MGSATLSSFAPLQSISLFWKPLFFITALVKMKILCSNPLADYLPYSTEILTAITDVLASGSYILGNEVLSFEAEFKKYLGSQYAIGVANGTDALQLALRCCELQPSDEVITVAHTASATVTAIIQAGGTPVFVDINPQTYTMDPDLLERALTPRTKAVIPVHIYGHPADMPSIMAFAQDHDLTVIEDCAQAHGACIAGKSVGTFGDFSCFSFYPTKNLATLGDGGLVVTKTEEHDAHIRALREYGWRNKFNSEEAGINSRLDELHAAILRVRLKYLDSQNSKRREIASLYQDGLSNSELTLPFADSLAYHVYHLFAVQTIKRDGLVQFLNDRGIFPGVHYPVPAHQQPAFAKYSPAARLPVTEELSKRIVSLPMYPTLGHDEVEIIISSIKEWFNVHP